MIYSVVPPELLEGPSGLPARSVVPVPGGLAEVWADGRMCRLISTDPALYLKEEFAPGALWRQTLPRGDNNAGN